MKRQDDDMASRVVLLVWFAPLRIEYRGVGEINRQQCSLLFLFRCGNYSQIYHCRCFISWLRLMVCSACDMRVINRRETQSSRLTGVRLWAAITLQTLWWEEGEVGHEVILKLLTHLVQVLWMCLIGLRPVDCAWRRLSRAHSLTTDQRYAIDYSSLIQQQQCQQAHKLQSLQYQDSTVYALQRGAEMLKLRRNKHSPLR